MKRIHPIIESPLFLTVSIGLLWLFHLSGMIGIAIGFEEWFIKKTPLNLSLAFLLLILNYPIANRKYILLTLLFFSAGILVEWIGVHYDFLFGSYSYGDSLGIKIDGVPILIGINWALLVLITGTLASRMTKHLLARIFIGSSLMVLLDFFMEVPAPRFDFWTFEGGIAPLQNYIAWFLIALVLHSIFQGSKIQGNLIFSFHLYLTQLVFFIFFYGYYHL